MPAPGCTPMGVSSRSPQPRASSVCAGLKLKMQQAWTLNYGKPGFLVLGRAHDQHCMCPGQLCPGNTPSSGTPASSGLCKGTAICNTLLHPLHPGALLAGDNRAAGEEQGAHGAATDIPKATKGGCCRAGAQGSSWGLPGHPTSALLQLTPGERAGEQNVPPWWSEQGREPQPQPNARSKTSKIKPSAGSLLTNKQQHHCCCKSQSFASQPLDFSGNLTSYCICSEKLHRAAGSVTRHLSWLLESE